MTFDLPEMKTINDAVPAMGALVKAVGDGDLTPTEAGELTKMVQAFAKIIETAGLEERVRKLEEANRQMTLESRLSKLEASILPESGPRSSR